MRENRPYGSEGGEGNSFPTPISSEIAAVGARQTEDAEKEARGLTASSIGSATRSAVKMKTRRGFLPAGLHRSRHHHSQYIRGKQLCREHNGYVIVECGISRAPRAPRKCQGLTRPILPPRLACISERYQSLRR